MAGRVLKKQLLEPIVKRLVDLGVTADMVTGSGVASAALAQGVRLSQLKNERTSINESAEYKSIVRELLRLLLIWAPTALMAYALLADGLDGEVAREEERRNATAVEEETKEEKKKNGQLVDGMADRFTIAIIAFGHFAEQAHEGKDAAATIATLDAFLMSVPSLLRALTEMRGGKTNEQSFNPIKFGGTHAGRWLTLIFLSLSYEQVLPAVRPFLGTHEFTREQWENVRIGLLAYLTISTSVVIIERARDLAKTFDPDFVAAVTDSSGFTEKTSNDHQTRAIWYGVAAGILGIASGVAISSLRKHDQ